MLFWKRWQTTQNCVGDEWSQPSDVLQLEDSWWATVEAYHLHTFTQQDAPKLRGDNAAEASLAGWAAKAQMAYRVGTLAQWKRDALNGLDMWSWGAQRGDRHRG